MIQDTHMKGVAIAHARAIAEVAARLNCFIFIRPSTDDTVRLIEAGMATKSNDVHDKSSDWGPMAGFVPVDQGLNKKSNSPSPEAARHPTYHPHGIEQQVHLTLTPKLLSDMLACQKMLQIPPTMFDPPARGTDGRVYHHMHNPVARAERSQPAAGGLAGLQIVGRAIAPPSPSAPSALGHQPSWTGNHRRTYYKATKNGTVRYFARDEDSGKMYWINDAPGASEPLVPIYVWGYHGTPITGDYDLWLVAPHIALTDVPSWRAATEIYLTIDEHGTPSAANEFIVTMNAELTLACCKALPGSKQVFNHGAEAQNYGFTQALGADEIAMFTPAGGFRGVNPATIHLVLADIERMGYLVVRNKKWTRPNPALGGQGHETHGGKLWRAAMQALRAKNGGRPIRKGDLEPLIDQLKRAPNDPGGRHLDPDTAKAYGLDKGAVAERKELGTFGRDLDAARQGGPAELKSLTRADFPDTVSALVGKDLGLLRAVANDTTQRYQGPGYTVSDPGKVDLTGLANDPNAFQKGLARPRRA